MARLNRSKNAERERAASFANCATVQGWVILSCMQRIATARRSSASPRTRPGDAAVPAVERSASIRRTSSRRDRITSRAGRCPRDSSPTSCTRVASRRSPRTCTSCGRSETSKAASGEPKTQWPTRYSTSGGPLCSPILNSPGCSATGTLSRSSEVIGARLDIIKPCAEGTRTKSPACRVSGSRPSTVSLHEPSRITQ